MCLSSFNVISSILFSSESSLCVLSLKSTQFIPFTYFSDCELRRLNEMKQQDLWWQREWICKRVKWIKARKSHSNSRNFRWMKRISVVVRLKFTLIVPIRFYPIKFDINNRKWKLSFLWCLTLNTPAESKHIIKRSKSMLNVEQ